MSVSYREHVAAVPTAAADSPCGTAPGRDAVRRSSTPRGARWVGELSRSGQGWPAVKEARRDLAVDVLAIVCAVLLLMGVVAALSRPRGAQAQVISNVRSDADWILTAQLPDGAIANYVDQKAIWPYLANYAAMGLAHASEVLSDSKYSTAAWRWLSWYQNAENSQGFVTDYQVTNGQETSTNSMDSTDAYAGTFLLAARSTYRVTADRARLAALHTGIAGAVAAIEATQQGDGLTWASPSWHVKYLMDEAEAYAGLAAASDLGQALGDAALAGRAKNDASRMKSGVDALWNTATASYDWAVSDTGVHTVTNWRWLYSDSLEQAWAVALGLVNQSGRAQALMTALNKNQPNWSQPAATALFNGGVSQTVGYWPLADLAFSSLAGPIFGSALTSIRAASVNANRAWPFTTGNAGQVLLTESYSPLTSAILALPGALLGPILTPTPTTLRPPATTVAPTTKVSTTTTTLPRSTPTTQKAPPPPGTTATTAAPPTPTTLLHLNASVGANGLTVSLGLGALAAQVQLGTPSTTTTTRPRTP